MCIDRKRVPAYDIDVALCEQYQINLLIASESFENTNIFNPTVHVYDQQVFTKMCKLISVLTSLQRTSTRVCLIVPNIIRVYETGSEVKPRYVIKILNNTA